MTNRACRVALGDRGVAHLTVSKDTPMMRLAADNRSMGNPGARTSSSWTPVVNQPPADQLRAAADVLNSGRKVAILVGQGAVNARAEVTQIADLLAAPVAKSLLGKAVLADDSPFTTGGIGHLGTAASSWAMKNCDAVFIIGSTMPWFEYYPKPGQAPRGELPQAPFRLIPVKFVAGLIAIGAGLALGREGPSIQMGASLAHLVGKVFHRTWPDCRVLVAAGRRGLGTAFNAPIAGAVFVLEELVQRFERRIAIAALVASATPIGLARVLLGDAPDFTSTRSATRTPEVGRSILSSEPSSVFWRSRTTARFLKRLRSPIG